LDAETDPKAVIIVGAYKPAATFIKLAKEELPDAVFLNVSFVGSIPLLKELGADAEGVIVTQVVPHFESDLEGVKAFRKHLASFDSGAAAGFLSLEGYTIAKILVEGIKKSDEIGRESIINGLESMGEFDLGYGSTNKLTKVKRQASSTVWPTRIKSGKYVSFNWDAM